MYTFVTYFTKTSCLTFLSHFSYQINTFSLKTLIDVPQLKLVKAFPLSLDCTLYELEENKKCQVSVVVNYIFYRLHPESSLTNSSSVSNTTVFLFVLGGGRLTVVRRTESRQKVSVGTTPLKLTNFNVSTLAANRLPRHSNYVNMAICCAPQ